MGEKPVLTHRERFIRTILLQEVDRPPYMLIFGPWGTTVTRWRNEGLPEDTNWGAEFGFDGKRFAPAENCLHNRLEINLTLVD